MSLTPGQALVVKEVGFDIANTEMFVEVVDMNKKTHKSMDTKIIKPNNDNTRGLTIQQIDEKERLWNLGK